MSLCKVLFFATLKDRTGVRQTTLDIPDGTKVSELKGILEDRFPSLSLLLPNALIAVNREYALNDLVIPPEAEIAIFPPVSGGTPQII
jgi:molybdopterin converting factor subunit 1